MATPDHKRLRVLAVMDHYLPAYKTGGPARSVAAAVEALGDELDFRVIAKDRDFGPGEQPFAGVALDTWVEVGKARCFYASPPSRSWQGLARLLRAERYDLVYLNSVFASLAVKTLWLRRARVVRLPRLLIAPRGEFDRGALGVKSGKKRAYLSLARGARLFSGATWQATSEIEAERIRNVVGRDAQVFVAPNLSLAAEPSRPNRDKDDAVLRVAFLSRIAPKKNLDGALTALRAVRVPVHFDVYGPREDTAYWARCEELIAQLPPNVTARHRGEVAAADVVDVLAGYDLFFLPTLGENFGHAIVEAMGAGCPVLVSDQTPWRGLRELRVGWDLPVGAPAPYAAAVEECFRLTGAEHRAWRAAARSYARAIREDRSTVELNERMFREAARR